MKSKIGNLFVGILILLMASCRPLPRPPDTPVAPSAAQISPAVPTLRPSITPHLATATPTSAPSPTLTATQSSPVSLSPILHSSWTSFTNANYIDTMLIDHAGNLWTAGDGGVVHWDVKTGTYVKYTPEHGLVEVQAIAQGQDGVLWFGTRGYGVFSFDGSQWTRYTTKVGLLSNVIYSVVVTPDGSIWFATDKGIARYDHRSWTSYLTTETEIPLSGIWRLAIAPDGTLWGFGYHLVYFDGAIWIETVERPDKGGFPVGLALAADGTVWIGGMDGVLHYNGQNWGDLYRPWRSLTIGSVSAIAVAQDGSLWVGLYIDCAVKYDCDALDPAQKSIPGVYRYDGKHWIVFSEQDGLVDNEICSIVAGLDGSMWFGSCSQGVSRFDGQSWTTFQTKNEPPANFIGKVNVSDPENVWIGPWQYPWGVAHYDGQEWVMYNSVNDIGTANGGIDAIYSSSNGAAWFGAIGALVQFDGHTWAKFSLFENNLPDVVYAITSLTEQTYLVGSSNGAFIFDAQRWAILQEFEELKGYSVDFLLVHPDRSLWFGVSGQGIYVYQNQVWKHYSQVDGLPSDDITSLGVQPDGTVWAAAWEGIARFDGTRWTAFTKEFADNAVTSLVVGGDGVIWVGTQGGLFSFDGQAWTTYSEEDGLVNSGIYDLAVDSSGAIWIATYAGLSRYIPSKP